MARIWPIAFLITALLGGGGLYVLDAGPQEAHVEKPTAPVSEPRPEEEPLHVEDREVRVPILIWHAVRPFTSQDGPDARAYNTTPEIFEAQLARLESEGYVGIGLDDLEDAVLRGKDLPERPVILTFDDGTWTHHTHVFPALVKHGFTGTFFLFSNAVDRPGYLTTDQVHEMRDAGMRFGNHTRYHQYLTRLPESEALAEIETAKRAIEELVGEDVDAIAYPFGLYDDTVVELAALTGHRIGRTIEEGETHGPEDLLTLKAYQINDSMGRLEYALGLR